MWRVQVPCPLGPVRVGRANSSDRRVTLTAAARVPLPEVVDEEGRKQRHQIID